MMLLLVGMVGVLLGWLALCLLRGAGRALRRSEQDDRYGR